MIIGGSIAITWIILCFLVGSFWENKGLSYVLGFFLSFFLSPLVGFTVGAVSNSKLHIIV
ncbi:MAG: hypothetical protein WC614_10355 [bacterium]